MAGQMLRSSHRPNRYARSMQSLLAKEILEASGPPATRLSSVVRRFLRYVQIDTQSNPDSNSVPSTDFQKELSRLLLEELKAAGVPEVEMDANGYVYARLPPVDFPPDFSVGLLAHVDTSPDEPGAARPLVHFDYDGGIITLPGDATVRLDPKHRPSLADHVGDHVITSDGTTLLGSDDKAGVAILTQLAEDLLDDPTPRPSVLLCFTVDEEIGRGVEHLDLERFDPDVAYTIDGGGMHAIYAETFNAAEAIVDVRGVMVHPGYAKGIMVNALRIMGLLLARLPAAEAPETTADREGYFHPHKMIESDPSHARAKLILRDFSEAGLARRKGLLRSLVTSLEIEHPGASIALDIRDEYSNMRSYIDQSDPRVLTFAHGAAAQMGIVLEERLVRGGTDGARLSQMGIPTPNIFNGGHDFHSRFEWNTAKSIDTSLAYVKTLLKYWGEHG